LRIKEQETRLTLQEHDNDDALSIDILSGLGCIVAGSSDVISEAWIGKDDKRSHSILIQFSVPEFF